MSKLNLKEIKESCELPIIMAPMFLISNPTMVVNACKNGIIGSFPALNARTATVLEEWMIQIKTDIANADIHTPWAVNFISNRKGNKRYDEDLALIEKYQPPIVITSLGDPSPVAKIVHAYGGLVFSDVINIKFAKKAIEKGTDGLILISNGAGGHGGTLSPIAFIHEVKTIWDGPIILGGGMSKGEDILAAEVIGADFAYLGTRFIPAIESHAQEEYKQMVIDSTVDDIYYTDAFTGVNANYLLPSILKAGLDLTELTSKGEMDLSDMDPEVKAWKHIWGAGQGVGPIKNIQSVAEIVQELKNEYHVVKQGVINNYSPVK